MTYFCLGFLFSRSLDQVLLIRKNRPAWQAGKLNGIGGKIEPNETPIEAMRREFWEEAGLSITDWTKFARLAKPFEFCVDCFYAVGEPNHAKTQTDEVLEVWSLPLFYNVPVISNLHWLLPLAQDHIKNPLKAEVVYEG